MPRCCSKRKKAANRSPTNGRATPQIGVSQRYSRKKYGKTCNADATHRLVGQGGNARLAPTRPCVIIDQLGEISRSDEHTSELKSLMRISYAVFCLKKKKHKTRIHTIHITTYTHH